VRERIELRVLEPNAAEFFDADEGESLGDMVRKVVLDADDPRLQDIAAAQRRFREDSTFLYSSWDIKRTYDDGELEGAELLQLIITSFFEPFGEECGTIYDESTACPLCGAHATQISGLRLDLRKLGFRRDIASTFAGEWVVSQRLASLFSEADISGVDLKPVRHRALYDQDPLDLSTTPSGRHLLERAASIGLSNGTWKFYVWLNSDAQAEPLKKAWDEYGVEAGRKARAISRPLRSWYQLLSTARPLSIAEPSLFGIDPLIAQMDPNRCIYGDTLGLNQLSEVTVERPAWPISDFQTTKEFVGNRRGLLRPNPLMLVSPRLGALLRENKIRGAEVQVAHYAS
jgi:hypothetical protein